MICPKCGSSNVNIQIVNESHLINKHHGFIWWLLVGWWWLFIKWLFFTLPALIFKIFGIGKRKKIKIIKQTEDLHKEPIWENNIETEHEKMFEEQGITTKAIIARII